jgi:hypothetical protein
MGMTKGRKETIMTNDEFKTVQNCIVGWTIDIPREWDLLVQAVLLLAQVVQEKEKDHVDRTTND